MNVHSSSVVVMAIPSAGQKARLAPSHLISNEISFLFPELTLKQRSKPSAGKMLGKPSLFPLIMPSYSVIFCIFSTAKVMD